MRERRLEDRMLCAELVELIWRDESGAEQRRVANLEDIAPRGVCLQTEKSVTVGSPVVVRCRAGEFTGAVRYCLYRGIGYFLGIQFSEGVAWSRQEYRPEHLLDPDVVVGKGPGRIAGARSQRGLRIVH